MKAKKPSLDDKEVFNPNTEYRCYICDWTT